MQIEAEKKHIRGFKSDSHARRLWGAAYDNIPKSVFATIAWHLANIASENCDAPGEAEKRAIAELEALRHGHIPDRQAAAAIKAIQATRVTA